jgi:hypothetical protein
MYRRGSLTLKFFSLQQLASIRLGEFEFVVEDAWAGVEAAPKGRHAEHRGWQERIVARADLAAVTLSDLPTDSFSSLLATTFRCIS